MAAFETPANLMHNRGLVADPEAYAEERGAASWLYLCGEEFASMEGGMSYDDVKRAVPVSAVVVSGLAAGASADEVLARAEADHAPFVRSDEIGAWIAQGLAELSYVT